MSEQARHFPFEGLLHEVCVARQDVRDAWLDGTGDES